MTSGLEVTRDKLKEVLAALEGLDMNRVLVGVPEEKGARTGRTEGRSINNAALAYIHEKGSDAAGIPPRPFLVPGIERAKDQIAADLREGASVTLAEMKPGAVEKALNKAGQHAVKSVQEVFTDNEWKQLKRSRPKKRRTHIKKAKNTTGLIVENPLIDTGALRRSISYVVRKK